MYPAWASTARPAIRQPSISRCGSYSINSRSLQVPGSLSSALTTIYFGLGELRGTKLHFIPVGNPAPPRPRRFEIFTSSMICSGFMLEAFMKARYPSSARYVSMAAEFGFPNRRERTRVSSGLGSLYIFLQPIQQPVQLFRCDLVMEVVVHLDRRRPRAGPDTFHFFKRDLSIRRHL